ncbi:ATP-binding protein [Ornithobacterium rhinotracheale]|uniref:AAA family ATPase n=1 Tax=Ornithobacterium rhinotracheale TaxID=28251 RepID=UPI00129CEC3B|nr:AAA family ATPase [Ornithobacterium rhinotracheale]MRI64004.1 ATP-binding protein [Ornithobacterium rhinotracheale]MRJ09392.1 ATP-binding protein [Ornithobacterium rhinotracheale]UOH78733.1 ATP-binding protein [Ornithobacterium rhinotracheale]
MNTQDKYAIAENLRAYITEHSIELTQIANKAEVPEAYIGYILKDDFTYKSGKKVGNIPDKYFYQLARFIGHNVEKVYWKNRPTEQLKTAIGVLEDAKKFGDTRLLIGATGSGKSHAIERFARKYPTEVFRIVVGSSDNLGDILDKIAEQLKITTGKTKSKRLRDIAKTLKMKRDEGLEPQFIFDEAEFLKQAALCAMKEIYDEVNKYCSLVFVGTEQLLDNLDRLRMKNKNGIPQFYRRVKFGIRRLPSIDGTFKEFLEEIEDKELVKFLRKECDNYGELHDVLLPSLREADRLGEEISLDLVKKVLNII